MKFSFGETAVGSPCTLIPSQPCGRRKVFVFAAGGGEFMDPMKFSSERNAPLISRSSKTDGDDD